MRNFDKNAMFCPKCLIHDTFFKGGGSWSPDVCPVCKNYDVVLYKNLTFEQQIIAKKKFDIMWKKERMNLIKGKLSVR